MLPTDVADHEQVEASPALVARGCGTGERWQTRCLLGAGEADTGNLYLRPVVMWRPGNVAVTGWV